MLLWRLAARVCGNYTDRGNLSVAGLCRTAYLENVLEGGLLVKYVDLEPHATCRTAFNSLTSPSPTCSSLTTIMVRVKHFTSVARLSNVRGPAFACV